MIIPQQVYEMQKYITTWHYSYDPLFLGIAKERWDSLDADTQAQFQEAATEAMEYQRDISREGTAEGLDFLKGRAGGL